MARVESSYAKLTRPRLHGAVIRAQLFSAMDQARARGQAIFCVAPPGAGKTTLLASWLDARGIGGIWYQVAPDDHDVATFFHYLAEAARRFARKGTRPLPVPTPEHLQDIGGFARHFFRELYRRMPPCSALVLDNYQDAPAQSELHQLTSCAL